MADEKKAQEIVILDVRDQLQIADFFVIGSGSNKKQVQAVADHIDRAMKDKGVSRLGIEGYAAGWWICLDYGGVVVHIFREATRRYYDLEFLWADARRLEWQRASA